MRPRLAIKRSNYSRSGAFSARGSTFVLRSVAVAPIALGIATRMSFRSYQDICLTHATRTSGSCCNWIQGISIDALMVQHFSWNSIHSSSRLLRLRTGEGWHWSIGTSLNLCSQQTSVPWPRSMRVVLMMRYGMSEKLVPRRLHLRSLRLSKKRFESSSVLDSHYKVWMRNSHWSERR